MTIKFSWGSGWMELKAEYIVENMSMTDYRKWVKLFARWGTKEQHNNFLQLVNTYITSQELRCTELQSELIEMQMKADGRCPTLLSPDYVQQQVKLRQSHLNGAKTKLKRYKTIYQVLEGLMS